MARLPVPGSDDGAWGQVLNDFLEVSHNSDGTIAPNTVDASALQDNSVAGVKLQDSTVSEAKLDISGGSNGQVLTKNSGLGGGMEWASIASAPDAALFGLELWTTPLYSATLTYGPGAQSFVAVLVRSRSSATITKLGTWITTAGSGAGAGVNGIGLYSEAGARLAVTGDMTAAFQTTGYVEGTLTSSYALVADTNYYLAFLNNFSTAPVLATNGSSGTYPIIRGHYPSVVAFGQTSFPVSVTPSSLTPGNLPIFLTAGI